MLVSSPEMLAAAFTAAINAGDVPAALELWLGDGALAQPDGTALRGRGAIESALQALVDNRVTLEIAIAGVLSAGDVAIVHGTLTLNGVGFDGEPYSQSSDSVVVYQRGPEGWRIAIDAPWGLPAR
jgi:ketosteroid isomerase-like protein